MDDVVSLVQERHEFLRALSSEPLSKPALVDATPYARSTVDRAIRELTEAGLVERDGACYRAAPAAVRMLDAFDRFRDDAGVYYEAREVLAGIPPEEPFPATVLEGADVQLASPEEPTRATVRGFTSVEQLETVRTTVPFVHDTFDRYGYRLVMELRADVELAFTPSVLEAIRAEYGDRWDAVLETGRVTVYVSDAIPSYVFYVADGLESASDGSELGITVRDERGHHAIYNDSAAAVAWGRDRWDSVVAEAECVHRAGD